MADYIPSVESDLIPWLQNFIPKLNTYGATLGFNPAEIGQLQTESSEIISNINHVEQQKADLRQTVQKKDQVKKANISSIRAAAARMKAAPTYTEDMGNAFGIIAPSNPVNPASLKPVLKISSTPTGVEVKFSKGIAQGISLYRRKKGEDFVKLGFKGRSPLLDTDFLPGITATYEYMALALVNDTETGQPSAIESVVYAS